MWLQKQLKAHLFFFFLINPQTSYTISNAYRYYKRSGQWKQNLGENLHPVTLRCKYSFLVFSWNLIFSGLTYY